MSEAATTEMTQAPALGLGAEVEAPRPDADAEIEELLSSLEASGARAFDPIAFQFGLTLARRGDDATDVARGRLRARARVRLKALEARFADARHAATIALDALAEVDPGAARALYAELRDGKVVEIAKRAKALTKAQAGAARGQALTRLMRVDEEARRRCPSVPPALEERKRAIYSQGETIDAGVVHAVANWYSLLLFRETTAQTRLVDTLADFDREIADEAGPYNPQAIAARTVTQLAEMSPAYIRVVLDQVADLAEAKRQLALDERPAKKKRGRGTSRARKKK